MSDSANGLESSLSVHAGCAAGPDHGCAGCDSPTGDESQADALLQASDASTGCAAPAQAAERESRATPPQSLRELERALRGLGYTRLQAEHIARDGFKAQSPEAEPDLDRAALIELRDAFKRSVAKLKA